MMKAVEAVYSRILELTTEKNISVEVLEKAAKLSPGYINDLPQCKNLELFIVKDICKALNVPLNEFFTSPLFNIENLTTE